MRVRNIFRKALSRAAWIMVLTLGVGGMLAADSGPQVQFDTSKAGPRQVEADTQKSLLRDYRLAWASLTQALGNNSSDALQGPFVGDAAQWLRQTVASQRASGITSRYSNQSHKVEAVFYAPEGDLIELHDTAQFELQVMDGGKRSQRTTWCAATWC